MEVTFSTIVLWWYHEPQILRQTTREKRRGLRVRPLPQWREKREFRFLLASQPPRSWGLTHVKKNKKTGLPLAETLEETDPTRGNAVKCARWPPDPGTRLKRGQIREPGREKATDVEPHGRPPFLPPLKSCSPHSSSLALLLRSVSGWKKAVKGFGDVAREGNGAFVES